MRLTAAKSSQLTTKNGQRKSKPPEPPVLPSDKVHMKAAQENKQAREEKTRERQEKLQIIPGPIALDWWDLPINGPQRKPSLVDAMDAILNIMWKEIPVKGITKKQAAEVHYYRKTLPKLVLTTHLHSIFLNDSTHVEREIRRNCQSHRIRRLLVNQVDGGELVIKCEDYYSALENAAKTDDEDVFIKFKQVLTEFPEATNVSSYDLEDKNIAKDHRSKLLNYGFLTLQPGQFDTYNISIPNLGSYLGVVSHCRKAILKIFKKSPWNEMLESLLKERWESYKLYWKDYKGANIEWILCDCYGGGWCEPFKTPVGRGWKLTGKT